jgi:hypothetical protein
MPLEFILLLPGLSEILLLPGLSGSMDGSPTKSKIHTSHRLLYI